ncbi:hypothetical protein JOQ06_024986 [Pogonophryne albipinna]|uniref:DUF4371 domain-containing protein n=1 Tax=Pogonophryne albipinna TaxID=1090488 RepID=A0AAD6AUU9_9TELE|nr:hypothetical protein JOQ06_024986 [Pogonophryne albipinna]
MENLISTLKHFSKLDFQSKQAVINNGRPMPELKDLLQTNGQKITRSFQTEWYQRKDWLCGCATKNRLYCFPCLLFSTSDNVWTNIGFGDLKNLPRSLNKHERSITHIQSQIALKTFGTSRIDLALNDQQRLNVSIHNAKVKENREILKDLINAVCFLAKQELAFRGNDESAKSSNRGNYVELLHAFAEKDETLARHLETSTVFSGLSNRIQNDLIEAVSDVIKNDIRHEINAAPFVGVEVNETTDVTNKAQVSVILRYVDTSDVKEAFLGFDDVSDDRRAPAIADYVLGVLGKYNCVEKLVAQTYDGAAVMASALNGVQAKIREKVPEAMFTHCYAHKLNLVLSHSAKCMPECRTFFKTVEGLAAFFNKSTKRTHLLDEVVKRRLPRAAPTRWSSNSRLVHTISMYQSDLRAVFRIMSENPDLWDNDTLMMAAGYDLWLSKASTCFFIMAYEGIFSETDALFRVLQNKVMDIGFCCVRIRDTMGVVERQRKEFDSFYDGFEQKCITLGLTDNVRRWSPERLGCLNPLFTGLSIGSLRRWWPFATRLSTSPGQQKTWRLCRVGSQGWPDTDPSEKLLEQSTAAMSASCHQAALMVTVIEIGSFFPQLFCRQFVTIRAASLTRTSWAGLGRSTTEECSATVHCTGGHSTLLQGSTSSQTGGTPASNIYSPSSLRTDSRCKVWDPSD